MPGPVLPPAVRVPAARPEPEPAVRVPGRVLPPAARVPVARPALEPAARGSEAE
ncbi:MAG: hypothetical protein WAK63_10825 [Xanthobacteraceae bacterium]